MPSVLIVDDLASIHEMLAAVIQPNGYTTASATDGQQALALYQAGKFDLVLADIDMKPMDGLTLLKRLKAHDPAAVVIIMTAYASTDSAVQALKFGAFDYLQKPFRVEELVATLKRGMESRQVRRDRVAEEAAVPPPRFEEIRGRLVAESPAMKKLVGEIVSVMAARTPVLLQGENGTGKVTVGEILHAASGAPSAQLVRVDCSVGATAAFRENVLGTDGAGGEWIRQARGGTLLLQDLPALSLSLQKEFVNVLRTTSHAFRLVCTTTEDLEQMCEEGRFYEELYHRVASVPLLVPALRERVEDIPLLVRQLIAGANSPRFPADTVKLAPDAMAVLTAYHWPGNLPELTQVVAQAVANTETPLIGASQLPLHLREVEHWPTLAAYLSTQEKQYIDLVLHVCRQDKSAAAKILGVDQARL